MNYTHKPVLKEEALNFLDPKKGQTIIDATVGLGGHSLYLLKKVDGLKIIGVDKDRQALKAAKENLEPFQDRVDLIKGNFVNLSKLINKTVAGVLLDLGVSSMQLDKAERGFAFSKNAQLDMRMDKDKKLTAKEIVNTYSGKNLEKILKEYGEERWTKKIVQKILQERPIKTTKKLAAVVQRAIPAKYQSNRIHPATRTFQAIRIEVNDELSKLKEGLKESFKILKKEGKLVVISYHSLEDRIVKNYFRYLETDCVCPEDYPICKCDKKQETKILTKKPITASKKEVENNPRSRSAKLRAIEKII